jgi:hypothetical protein
MYWAALMDWNIHFRQQRPIMELNNRLDRSSMLRHINGELAEFNGVEEVGFWSALERREKYRDQELADIVIFALEVIEKTPGLELRPRAIKYRLDKLMADPELAAAVQLLPVRSPVTEPLSFLPAEGDDLPTLENKQAREAAFNKLQALLNQKAELFTSSWFDFLDLDPLLLQKELKRKQRTLDEILAVCHVMFALLGRNLFHACGEKVARNIDKYAVQKFLMTPEKEAEKAGKPDDVVLQLITTWYREISEKCKDLFDGPKDAAGNRAQTGTEEFYREMEMGWSPEAVETMMANAKPIEEAYLIQAKAISDAVAQFWLTQQQK